MPNEKLFTAKEAATAVLAKAQEMLAKADMMKPAPSTDKNAPGETDQTSPQGVKAAPNPARPNDKINGNPAPGALPQNEEKFAAEGSKKGHLALAKFMGRMEHKRSQAAPAPAAAAPAPAPSAKPAV